MEEEEEDINETNQYMKEEMWRLSLNCFQIPDMKRPCNHP